MSKPLFNTRKSYNWLLNQTPLDGCLLLFNAKNSTLRAEVSELEILRCHKISDTPMHRHERNTYVGDFYIILKE